MTVEGEVMVLNKLGEKRCGQLESRLPPGLAKCVGCSQNSHDGRRESVLPVVLGHQHTRWHTHRDKHIHTHNYDETDTFTETHKCIPTITYTHMYTHRHI